MDDALTPATTEDLDAAQRVLELHADLVPPEHHRDLQLALAGWRANTGREMFDLKFGLREPNGRKDQIFRDMFQGVISKEVALQQIRSYVRRPVDAEMVQHFFAELEAKLGRYAKFMQEAGDLHLNPTRQPVRDQDEQELDRLVAAADAKLACDKNEIQTVDEFLQEARIDRKMGNVKIGGFTSVTAATLVLRVTTYAAASWKNCRDLEHKTQTQPEYGGVTRAVTIFANHGFKSLPRAQDLYTLLAEEQALARLHLKAKNPQLVTIEVVAPSVVNRLFDVSDWTELAIGIDEKGRYWALTPVPEDGRHFRKSNATELILPAGRWSKLLAAFAESKTGDLVKRRDLLSVLGYFAPATSLELDGRARPGQIEAAQVEGMILRQQAALTRLKNTLADLRREIGELVGGPADRSRICLRTQGENVFSGFRVRYLLGNEEGKVMFGATIS